MKKMVLLVLLSVMSVGVAADSAHAIFGGRAWRATARQEGFGLFGLRRNKSGRFFRKSASVERDSQGSLDHLSAVLQYRWSDHLLDREMKLYDLRYLAPKKEEDEEDPFDYYKDLK